MSELPIRATRRSFFGVASLFGLFGRPGPDPAPSVGAKEQPRPLATVVEHIRDGWKTATKISRTWPEGSTGEAGGCRLCDRCRAKDDKCMMIAEMYVFPEMAGMFSTVGLKISEVAPSDDPLAGKISLALTRGHQSK